MKKVLVTGGTRGIGAAISILLNKSGYDVVSTYANNSENAQNFSKQHGITVESADVTNYTTCTKLFEKIGSVYGIIHNAGIANDAFFHKMTPEQWHAVLNTNLNSCFNVIRPFITGMRDANMGRIVVLSSINGLKGQMGQTNYCAAKAGMIGFVKALALENARKNITVNAIAPGYIATDMMQSIDEKILDNIRSQIPQNRLGNPDEIAESVMYLLSNAAGFMTGETLNINGGHYMH